MLHVEAWLHARAWSFQKHRIETPLLGRSQRLEARALTQLRPHSNPQKRKQPFFSAEPLKLSTRRRTLRSPGNRSVRRQRPAGGSTPQPFLPRRLSARARRVGVPGSPNLWPVLSSVTPPAGGFLPFSGARLGPKGREEFQGRDGSGGGHVAKACGRFSPLREGDAGPGGGCLHSGDVTGRRRWQRPRGRGPRGGSQDEPQGRMRRPGAKVGNPSASLLRWGWLAVARPALGTGWGGSPLGPTAGPASEHSGVARWTIWVEEEEWNVPRGGICTFRRWGCRALGAPDTEH